MVLTRLLLLAPCHGLTFQGMGFPHPYLQAALLHMAAILMCTQIRLYQLRAFHRWLSAERLRASCSKQRDGVSKEPMGVEEAAPSPSSGLLCSVVGKAKRE